MAAAATTGNHIRTASLPNFSSKFTTETHAIHLAPTIISATKGKNFSLFTDSRTYIQALQPKTTKTEADHSKPAEIRKNMELFWIPGHASLPGNEIADKKAKEAARRQEEIIAFPYQNLFRYVNDAIHEK